MFREIKLRYSSCSVGFTTLAIDKTVSRTEDMHIATYYDLSCDDQVDSLLTLMEKGKDIFFF